MRQNILTLLAFVFLFCCINFCLANVNLQFNRITLDNGLAGNRYNNFIFEDSQGFIWISSMDGLNRFDGNQVKNYRSESGLISNNIQSDFFEDKENNIWFTTYESINCYNRKNDRINTYRIKNESSDYQAFYFDLKDNILWLRAGNSIYKWNTINKTEQRMLTELPSTAKTFKVATNANKSLNHIAILFPPNEIWLVYPNKNPFKKIRTIPYFVDLVYLMDDEWLLYGKKNNTYIFDADDPDNFRMVRNDQIEKVVKAIKYNNKNHFISTNENGLWLYNWQTGNYINHWKHQPKNQFSLLSNNINNIYISKSTEYLWISHPNKGVNYAYINKNHFYNPLKKVKDEEMEVRAVIQTSLGNIWVTTKLSGIYVFTKNGSFIHHFDLQFDSTGFRNTIEFDNQSCLTTSSQGIYLLDLNNKTVEKLSIDFPSHSFCYLENVFPDRYLVSTTNGVMEIKRGTNKNLKLQYCSEFLEHKAFKFLQIHQTIDNELLLPYNGNELWVYKCSKDSLTLIAKNPCNLQFYGFYKSQQKDGVIWAGTSKGLHKIDSSYIITPVECENAEFTKGNVYGVVEDYNGILWLTTNTGLWKYNPNTNESPVNFGSIDGLSGEQFSFYNSALHASDGTIWMGNNKGLVVFHPDSVAIYKEVPKIYLEGLLINDTQPFKDSITLNNKLELKYYQNTLTFDIKAVNLYKTKQNKIHYQLTGYDEDMLQISNNEKIRYTKIKPDKYTLNVYAEDANGHKSGMEELLFLTIKPPWWKTKWFYALFALGLSLLAYTIYKLRINYIIEQEAKKTDIERLKAEVLLKEQAKKTAIAKLETQVLEVEMKALKAQMNPHFLFNSLNSIKSLILKTKEKEASAYLSKFSTLLRSILNNSEKQRIKLSEEIEALCLYIDLEALRFASNFNYQIQIDKTIDSSFIRIPPLLLQPFVENAIWHGLLPKTSGDSKLNINVIRKEDFLFFEIEDNGVGRKKAATLPKTENQKSMGIGITKKRIQLLHDENDIEIIDLVDNNQLALGTKVVIKLYAPE